MKNSNVVGFVSTTLRAHKIEADMHALQKQHDALIAELTERLEGVDQERLSYREKFAGCLEKHQVVRVFMANSYAVVVVNAGGSGPRVWAIKTENCGEEGDEDGPK